MRTGDGHHRRDEPCPVPAPVAASPPANFVLRLSPGTCPNATLLCESCPKFAGTSKIPICPLCGDLCKRYGEVSQTVSRGFKAQVSAGPISGGLSLSRSNTSLRLGVVRLLIVLLLLAGFPGGIVAYVIMFAASRT